MDRFTDWEDANAGGICGCLVIIACLAAGMIVGLAIGLAF